MELVFRHFRQEHYREYAAWFADADLARWLGPMDTDWLDAVLSEPDSEGVTWAVFRGEELVAVVETCFDPRDASLAYIRAIAVKPALRRQGIGSVLLLQLFDLHAQQGITAHITFISIRNPGSIRFLERLSFGRTPTEPNERGYAEWRRAGSQQRGMDAGSQKPEPEFWATQSGELNAP